MKVGSCNVGRGTARRVTEQSKLSEKDDKDKKTKKTNQSETQKINKDRFLTANNVGDVAATVISDQNLTSSPILNKLV